MKIRNIEFDFDFMDADDVERIEKEMIKVKNQSEEVEKKKMPTSQAIREECKIIDEFFDNVLGENASDKLFNGKMNLWDHIKCYEDLINEKIARTNDLQKTFDKYQPKEQKKTKRGNK